jgi:hypothetical protein
MSQPITTPQKAIDRPGVALLAILVWLAATGLLVIAVVAYYGSGAVDETTDGERFGWAAITIALAWPLLALFIGLSRAARQDGGSRGSIASSVGSAFLLCLFACAALGLAWLLGDGRTLAGAVAWALYWLAALGAWIALSRRCARGRTRRR